MIESVSQALSADVGGRPLEKWVLVRLALSEGMKHEPFPVTKDMIVETELSHVQFWAALNDLHRRRFIRLDAAEDPATVKLLL